VAAQGPQKSGPPLRCSSEGHSSTSILDAMDEALTGHIEEEKTVAIFKTVGCTSFVILLFVFICMWRQIGGPSTQPRPGPQKVRVRPEHTLEVPTGNKHTHMRAITNGHDTQEVSISKQRRYWGARGRDLEQQR
jgi:hypothetical protein